MVASHKMFCAIQIGKLWRFLATALRGVTAAGMEVAAWGRVSRTGNIALQNNLFPHNIRIGIWNRREQCLGIRMLGIQEEWVNFAHFHDAP